jgi:hypothetical protein
MNMLKLDLSTAKPLRPRYRCRRPHRTVTGQNLAKATRGARERAELAAEYVRGGLSILDPTVVLVARIFGVSVPMIRAALDGLECSTVTPATGALWSQMTPAEKREFVRANTAEVRRIFDAVTEPAG